MSTVVGNVVTEVHAVRPDIPAHTIASALAVVAGAIVLFVGLIRVGWVVELIPLTALSAFMTGSAINIAVGQVPTMMGITGFSTRESTYLVLVNTLKHLSDTKIDAVMGLTALVMLYTIRHTFGNLAKRFPKQQRLFFFLNTMRTVFVILLYTMISWLVNMHRQSKPMFKILGTVPRGIFSTLL
jgi:solute carrier family 26 (sodium-independent sulfate anion transporter), member 11